MYTVYIPTNTKLHPNQHKVAHVGRCGSGGKCSRLAVGGLPVRSHPGRVEVPLSKTPNPQLLLTS